MSYGKVAVDAVNIFRNGGISIIDAWSQALIQNNVSDKSCPRVAFLGLCEDGFIKYVPKGQYLKKTNSILKQRAIKIRNKIMNTTPPQLPQLNKRVLWNQVGGRGNDQGVIKLIYDLFSAKLLL